LYAAQVPTRKDSPVHRATHLDTLAEILVGSVMRTKPIVVIDEREPARETCARTYDAWAQSIFPVIHDGAPVGLIKSETLRLLAAEPDVAPWVIAADLMEPFVTVRDEDDLRLAAQKMVRSDLHQIPALDEKGKIVGLVDEHDISRAYLEATTEPSGC
jgi:CIC family chloride channel protein